MTPDPTRSTPGPAVTRRSFLEMLGLIEEALTEAGLPYVKLTGQTKDRETPVRRFQDGAPTAPLP